MIARTARRLPGFRFEAQPPPLPEVLPRMDVAVFVGFAASGPLHTPVVVEDVAHFTALFGEAAPLVWDAERGERVHAHLASAVGAFFRNGGRRCWVVRVTGQAQTDHFPIPRLARFAGGNIRPAFAQARSEGGWADALRVGATLLSRPIQVMAGDLTQPVVDLAPASPGDISIGDLLRVTFRETGHVLMFVVQSVTPVADASPPVGPPMPPHGLVRVTGSTALWFQLGSRRSPPSESAEAHVFTYASESRRIPAFVPRHRDAAPGAAITWPDAEGEATIQLDLRLSLADAPIPGSLVRVDFGDATLWLAVQDVSRGDEAGSPPAQTVRVKGEGLWQLKDPPAPLPALNLSHYAERLTFELWTRQGNAYPMRLSELGFHADHPRFWGALPTDLQLYADAGLPVNAAHAALRQSAATPRFPLAGEAAPGAVYFPISMSPLPDYFLGLDPLPRTALERDGLSQFDARLFLDPQLIESPTETLLAQADFLRYWSPTPCALTGLHAALGVEEATLIAVPDAVHRGWLPPAEDDALRVLGLYEAGEPDQTGAFTLTWLSTLTNATYHLEESTRPDFSDAVVLYTGAETRRAIHGHSPGDYYYRVRADADGVTIQSNDVLVQIAVCQTGDFLNCDFRVIPAPGLALSVPPDQTGTFTLAWSSVLTDARYSLAESTRPDFGDAALVYTGPDDRRVIYGRSPGDYYYRVRAEVNGAMSDWSDGLHVRVAPDRAWQLRPADQYAAETLLAVQRALLRMCAARGDMLAVLALPEHYREDEALAHVAALKSPLAPPIAVGTRYVAALGFGEARAFSYGALYHPWLIGREESASADLDRTPPDGVATGLLAQRALARGAWVAPANELLRGMVALTPPMARDRWLDLQAAHVNLVRQEPRGFLTLSTDTLSDDPDLQPINVRRLLILLRRLALRLGATYVFEPNSPSFRRLVERGFEAMLGQLFARGAFAGRTPVAAFQVVMASTPQDVEQGRFIVELRVAPSQPLTFLTVRLVQSGDRGVVAEGG